MNGPTESEPTRTDETPTAPGETLSFAARLIRGKHRRIYLVVAFCIVLGTLAVGGRTFGLSSGGGEPSSTASYLRGQQTYDASLVWDSYSDRVIQDLQQSGDSVEQTQRWLDRLRELGARIERVQYIGGSQLPSGSMHFYLIARTSRGSDDLPRSRFISSATAQNDLTYLPYVFTLNERGKIDRVE